MKNFAWLALCLSFASACDSDENPGAGSDTKAQSESRGRDGGESSDAAAESDAAAQRDAAADSDKGDAGAPVDTAAASDGDAQGGKSLYVIATAVSTDDTASTYVAALDSLESEKLDLSQAREFGGWSDIGVVGDWVFVSSGEAPEISRFTVDEKLRLQDAGSINFGDYTSDANFYMQTLVSPTKAYLVGQGELVIWNPTKLEITGTLKFPDVVKPREGIEGYVALDRGAVVRDNRLYATVAWSDTEQLQMLPDSRIVVIDLEKDEVVEVLDVPCPDMGVADRDAAGNLYFSNWVYSPGATLINDNAPTCAVRIAAGSDKLDDWKIEFNKADGHEGAVLNYLGENKWLFSSFLGEVKDYNPETDEWFDWLFGDTWQLEVLDTKTDARNPVTGIPKNGGGYYSARFDNTTHILIPGESYTSTTVYSLGTDGAATKKLFTEGWSTRLFKLR